MEKLAPRPTARGNPFLLCERASPTQKWQTASVRDLRARVARFRTFRQSRATDAPGRANGGALSSDRIADPAANADRTRRRGHERVQLGRSGKGQHLTVRTRSIKTPALPHL